MEITTVAVIVGVILLVVAGLLARLLFVRMKKNGPAPRKTKAPAAKAKPPVVVGRVKLSRKERMERSVTLLEEVAQRQADIFAETGRPTPGSASAMLRAGGAKKIDPLVWGIRHWLAE
jgi:Flp pilus assembly protein CpaB